MLNHRVADKLGISVSNLIKIRNIIFDLGGVIIDIRFQDTIKQFKKLGFVDFDSIYNQLKETRLFDLFETGQIPPQAFRNELRKYRNQLTDEQIDYAWNLMIGDMPEGYIKLFKTIKKDYQTYMLSNTNAIHMDYFESCLDSKYGHNPLPDMFEQIFYSFEMGERKPDIKAYDYLVARAGLRKEETLFIDDLGINIKGAREAGLLAYHLENETLTDLFD